MKTQRKWGALALMVLIPVFSLAGCSDSSDTATDSSATTTSTSAESETAGETSTATESAYSVGVITAVGSSQITIALYESDDTIDYLSDIDPDTLTATGETTTVTFDDTTVVERYDNGVITTLTTSELAIDDLVAISEDDGQTIAIIAQDDTDTTSDTTSYSNDYSTTSENATSYSDDSSTASEDTTSYSGDSSTSSEDTTSFSDDSSTASEDTSNYSENTTTISD